MSDVLGVGLGSASTFNHFVLLQYPHLEPVGHMQSETESQIINPWQSCLRPLKILKCPHLAYRVRFPTVKFLNCRLWIGYEEHEEPSWPGNRTHEEDKASTENGDQ